MDQAYTFKPSLVTRIIFCTHKGRRSGSGHAVHCHSSFAHELIYLDYGAMRLTLGRTTLNVRPGECVFIPGGTPHSFVGAEGVPFDFLNIMFRGHVPGVLWKKRLTVDRQGLNILERLRQESEWGLPYARDIIPCSFTELIVRLYRQITAAVPPEPLEPAYRRRYQSEVVNRALAVVAAGYAKPLALAQVSRSAGISTSHLRSLLKIETGRSFSRILHERRIGAAKHLLQQSTMPLADIVEAVGYRSSSFFFKVFKRQTGMTPAAYARSLGDPSERK